jgi:hypothetical protein
LQLLHGCIFFSVRKRDKVSKEIIESLGHAITLFDYRLNGFSLLAKDMIHSNGKIKDEGVFRLLEVLQQRTSFRNSILISCKYYE